MMAKEYGNTTRNRCEGLEANVLVNAGSRIDAGGSEARVLINAFIRRFTLCMFDLYYFYCFYYRRCTNSIDNWQPWQK